MCGYSPKSTQAAFDTLQVAIKYECVDLVEHLVDYLSKNLQPENVLQIMKWGYHYSSSSMSPSAPPSEDGIMSLEDDLPPPYPGTAPPPPYEAIYERDLSSRSYHLVDECLKLLDARADEALASDALEELSTPLLSSVLSRDTLGVSSEVTVLDALYRWSSAECRRQHQPLTFDSRRRILGQMLTLPRLLTMSASQIPALEKLFQQHEIQYVSAVVTKNPQVPEVPALFSSCLPQLVRLRKASTQIASTDNNRNKQKNKNTNKKRFSAKQLMWDAFSAFVHVID